MEEARVALADDPQALQGLDALEKQAAEGKTKKKSSPALSEGSWVADVYIDKIEEEFQCLTYTENPSGVPGKKFHYHFFYADNELVKYEEDMYQDQLWHSSGYSNWEDCPVEVSVRAEVWRGTVQKMAWDTDWDECN